MNFVVTLHFFMKDFDSEGVTLSYNGYKRQTYDGVKKGISCLFVRQNKVIRDLIVAPELERISWNFCDRHLSLLKKRGLLYNPRQGRRN